MRGKLPNLRNLTNLEELIIKQNKLSGNLLNLDGLFNLTLIDLSMNALDGTIHVLSRFTKLTRLVVYHNYFIEIYFDFS